MIEALDTQRLRAARERIGLQQIELSVQLGLRKGAVSEYERGTKAPRYGVLKQLCVTLGVSADWLLGLDTESVYRPVTTHAALPDNPDTILSDMSAPAGLRALANSRVHQAAHDIQPDEWAALASLQYRDGLTIDGYTALLVLLRATALPATKKRSDADNGGCEEADPTSGQDDDPDGGDPDGGDDNVTPMPAIR